MSTTSPLLTARQLEASPPDGRWELVQGELREMSPSSIRHAWVAASVAVLIRNHVVENSLGMVIGAEGGFLIESDPDTVRGPDAALICPERIKQGLPETGFFPGAPDFAVEVISPGDTSTAVSAKSEQWLRSGCRTVWLIDPGRETAAVCTLEDGSYVMRSVEILTEPELLPGFELPVNELFQQ